MVGPSSLGAVMIAFSMRSATIYVYTAKANMAHDFEETIVHEMIHIWLYQFSDDISHENERALEQGINALSEGLVSLRRSAKLHHPDHQ